MKKALCSTAAAALFIFALSGCADTEPVQTGDHPPQPTVEITLGPSTEPTEPVESEAISFSAGNAPLAQDSTANEDGGNPVKLELPAEPSPTPAPQTAQLPQVTPAPQAIQTPQESAASQETPPLAKGTIKFDVTTQKEAGESPAPAPSATPEPEPTPVPPTQSEPPVEPTPTAFNIDYWITYAQNYARSVGLNLDPTATACWDNPITAGAHCAYLERDIQSRLNRYANDDTILDVWIWAEPRTDGSYDLYIGYA